MTPQAKRAAVAEMQSETAISERRACQLVGLARSALRYQPCKSQVNDQLQARIIELAQERRRFGYRRIHALLRREGYQINHKRTYRRYRQAEPAVRRRKKRQGVAVPREPLVLPQQRNMVWSIDFIYDALSNGHIRCWIINLQPRRPSNYGNNGGSTEKNMVLIQGAGQVDQVL